MFKPLQTVDWFYTETNKITPQSTTHEMLERGIAKTKKVCNTKKINFEKFRFDQKKIQKPVETIFTTSYNRNFAPPLDNICPRTVPKEDVPDRLWNRIPLNDFALERLTSSEFKFMDDHLINISPERRKVNYFRQIRNQHFPLI